MASFTTRLGLTKPAGTEDRSVTPLNGNADLMDKFLPCILVNDGVTPPTGDLYDGALVKERTSGIIWEARKNGGGTYDKVYVRYPYSFNSYYAGMPVSRGSGSFPTFIQSGVDSVISALCKNATVGDISGGSWKVPIKGVYDLQFRVAYNSASTVGVRGICFRINGTTRATIPSENYVYEIAATPGGSDTVLMLSFSRLCFANDLLDCGCYQNSGVSINQTQSTIIASMIEPVQ